MSTTRTNPAGDGDGGTESSTDSTSWSNLPDDLLGNIRLRVASMRDRVSLAAVCRPWRAAVARLPGLPAVPLLLLWPRRSRCSGRKHLCGPDDTWVTRAPAKVDNDWPWFVGSHDGGWVATVNNHKELMIANFFSGADVAVPLPRPQILIEKIVFSDAPTSSNGCILAAIRAVTLDITLCKVGCDTGWTIVNCPNTFQDIAFCAGHLYGFTFPDEELFKFNIDIKEDGVSMVTSTHQVAVRRRHGPTVGDHFDSYKGCIIELHGKLSVAIRTRWLTNREPFFKLFMLVDENFDEDYQHQWAEVMRFNDYALFLGPIRSKAVHVPMGADRRGLVRNHIYYSEDYRSKEDRLPGDELYSVTLEHGYHMYCKEDQSIGDGIERTRYCIMGRDYDSLWLHPPDM